MRKENIANAIDSAFQCAVIVQQTLFTQGISEPAGYRAQNVLHKICNLLRKFIGFQALHTEDGMFSLVFSEYAGPTELTNQFLQKVTVTDRDSYCYGFVLVVFSCRFQFILCLG